MNRGPDGETDGDAADVTAVDEAREEWREETTALQRVQQVVERTRTPKTARELGEEALVSEPTARKHLRALVDVGTATATETPNGTTYARDEDALLYRRISELATEHTREELLASVREMKARLRELEATYDAASPEELATTLDGDAPASAWEAVGEWQTTERNLHIAQAAINYSRARDLGAATQ